MAYISSSNQQPPGPFSIPITVPRFYPPFSHDPSIWGVQTLSQHITCTCIHVLIFCLVKTNWTFASSPLASAATSKEVRSHTVNSVR